MSRLTINRALPVDLIEIDEQTLAHLAASMGKPSSSSEALIELKRRRAAGEDAACYRIRGVLTISPRRLNHDSRGESRRETKR